jgi:hypothetical protein
LDSSKLSARVSLAALFTNMEIEVGRALVVDLQLLSRLRLGVEFV